MDNDHQDLSPEQWQIYGYVVLSQVDNDKWQAECSDEYTNLPAYEPFRAVAEDRVKYLREHNIEARLLALIQDPEYDTPERMDNARKERHDTDGKE